VYAQIVSEAPVIFCKTAHFYVTFVATIMQHWLETETADMCKFCHWSVLSRQ